MADVKTVNLGQFEKDFFHHLNELRLGNLFCDVRFNVNGTIMPCHRVVLATASPYFRTMFNGNFKESNCDTITMGDIETEAFEEILNAMYTASINFSPSNAFFILKASHFLQWEIMENACTSYLMENPKINYLIETCVFADTIKKTALYWACIETIDEEIFEYGKTESFIRIPIHILEDICNKEFSDSEEESFFLLIMKWCRQNETSRENIQKLLNLADLNITKYLNSSLMTELLLTCDDKRIVDGNTDISQESNDNDFNLPLKLYLNGIDVKTGQQGWCILKMCGEMKKYAVSSFYPTNSRFKKVCKIGSKLYCFEYQEEKNVFSSYDDDSNRIFLPSPEDEIFEFEMFATGTSIYVMSIKHCQLIVWLYNIEQNTWLNLLMENIHETIYCNVSAYTFSDDVFYLVAEKYRSTPRSRSSIKKKYIYSISRSFLKVTRMATLPSNFYGNQLIYAFNGKIAVSGTRHDGTGSAHNSFVIYDKEAKQWPEKLTSMNHGRVNFNLFHFNNFIYAVENGRAVVPNEKYDLKLNKWIDLPALPKQLTIASTNDIVATGEVSGVEVNL